MADDPRDSNLEVKISRPREWTDTQDVFAPFSMVLAGAAMITRNRQIAWPGLAIALSGWVNQRPLTAKEGGQGIGPALFAVGSIVTAYLPMVILPNVNTGSSSTQTPLSF